MSKRKYYGSIVPINPLPFKSYNALLISRNEKIAKRKKRMEKRGVQSVTAFNLFQNINKFDYSKSENNKENEENKVSSALPINLQRDYFNKCFPDTYNCSRENKVNTSFNFNKIPKKIISNILQMLSNFDDQLNVRLVCKLWNSLSKDSTEIKLKKIEKNPWKHIEKTKQINYQILYEQPEVNFNMREILIDWLVDVHVAFEISTRAFFLAVGYIDKLLSIKRIYKKEFQLVGITCLWIASKFEDITCNPLSEIVSVCDGAYTSEGVLYAEKKILNSLNWELYCPSVLSFASLYLSRLDLDKQFQSYYKFSNPPKFSISQNQSKFTKDKQINDNFVDLKRKLPHLVEYICTITTFYAPSVFMKYCKSEVASCVVFIALYSLQFTEKWPACLSSVCDLQFDQHLLDCLKTVFSYFRFYVTDPSKSKYNAILNKYKTKTHGNVASLQFPHHLPLSLLSV